MHFPSLLLLAAAARAIATTATSQTRASHCTSFILPSNGILEIDASTTITLTRDSVFQPICTGSPDLTQNSISATLTDLRDPFYASTIPQCYALAATTVMAYTLVIMLLITPRTFLQAGGIVLGRRGFTNGPSGDVGIGIGGRPWLQKVAALTVAVSLTIATADTFKVAQAQYEVGFMDASKLQQQVLDGTELKVMRIISDTFLWLAQAQTLIRLFPRQREKIIIKWTAFALILLDLIFGILDSFVTSESDSRPRSFNSAIPALSYLFQLALGVLYCAWVIYYSITKKRYAFYHPQMRNICLVALLSVISLLVPVVFFMTDIINHDVAAWGDYVRWVGAAAASVVVWEWVERIEALERNDKKDGVLGREVFDGDEMLDATPASDVGHHRRWNGGGSGSGKTTGALSIQPWPAMAGFATKYRARLPHSHTKQENGDETAQSGIVRKNSHSGPKNSTLQLPSWPARPARIATPISRTDTGSAESTVYAVRYHPIGNAGPGQPIYDRPIRTSRPTEEEVDIEAQRVSPRDSNSTMDLEKQDAQDSDTAVLSPPASNFRQKIWGSLELANPFKRRGQLPPAEVSAHTAKVSATSEKAESTIATKWDIIGKLEDYASVQAEKFQARDAQNAPILPVTRIPAPTRNRTFQEMADLIEEDESRLDTGRHDSDTVIGQESPVIEHRDLAESGFDGGYIPSVSNGAYTPADHQVVAHRGNLSFAAVATPREEEASTDRRPASGMPIIPSPAMPRSEAPSAPTPVEFARTMSGESAGLRVIRVPAPPRRRRTMDEEDE